MFLGWLAVGVRVLEGTVVTGARVGAIVMGIFVGAIVTGVKDGVDDNMTVGWKEGSCVGVKDGVDDNMALGWKESCVGVKVGKDPLAGLTHRPESAAGCWHCL